MATCLGELHFWTLKNQTMVADDDTSWFKYHDKTEAISSAEHPYYEEKLIYTESRDSTWTPKNKRPERLRDTLKETEDLLAANKCVWCNWASRQHLQIILSSGVLVTIIVTVHTGDIDKIFIDKSLVGKISSDNINHVLVTESYIVTSYPEKSKLDYIYFTKKLPSGDTSKKLSVMDPKVLQVDLPGPTGRRLDRHLSCNLHQDMVLAWWPTASEEAWPWAPMTSDRERANLVLLAINGNKMDIVAYTRTDLDPLDITFSLFQPQQIYTTEQMSGAGGENNVDMCVYENTRGKVQRMAVTTIPLKSRVIAHGRNHSEDKVLLGCGDGTLVMYDEHRRVTQTTQAALVPSMVAWHPTGTLVLVAGTKAEIQVFDMALAPLLFQPIAENPCPRKHLDFTAFFRSPPSLSMMEWSPIADPPDIVSECIDSVFLAFDRGPLAVLQFHLGVVTQGSLTPLHLINQYIKYRQIDEAINLLGSLNWSMEGGLCYAGLTAVVNHLLQEPLNADREAQLEAALGTFYAPTTPLTEATVLEYRDPISRLARRFFHHLLRFSRFEKAFLLAVDIGARDLFMDIHYLAKDKGELSLAEVAKQKADQIDAESLGPDALPGEDPYEAEDDSDEDWEDGHSDSDEAVDTPPPRPPPRRQVPRPSLGKGPPPPLPGEAGYGNLRPVMTRNNIPGPGAPLPPPRYTHWQAPYMRAADVMLEELEAQMSRDMFHDYAAALSDEPLLRPQQGAQESQGQNADQPPRSVKVIHFGLV